MSRWTSILKVGGGKPPLETVVGWVSGPDNLSLSVDGSRVTATEIVDGQGGSGTLRATVTDDEGNTVSRDFVVEVPAFVPEAPPPQWFAEITAGVSGFTPDARGYFSGSEVRIGNLDGSSYTGSGTFVSGVWFEEVSPGNWVFRVAMAAEDGLSPPPAADAVYGVAFTDNTSTLREFVMGDAVSTVETALLNDVVHDMRVWTWVVAGPAFTDGAQYIVQETQPF